MHNQEHDAHYENLITSLHSKLINVKNSYHYKKKVGGGSEERKERFARKANYEDVSYT